MNKKRNNTANVPNLRFPGFSASWKTHKLGEVAQFSKGKGIPKKDICEEGKFECIRYGELYTHYGEVINKVISKTDINKENLIFSEENDVIIPSSGETQLDIATASCVIRTGIALGGDLNIIKTPNNGVFLSYYLNNNKKIKIARMAQGSSVVHLYSKQLASLKINFPLLEEQNMIASFLTLIDKRIRTQNKIIDNLELLKKGLLQKVFSQEIRFKNEKNKMLSEWKKKSLGQICKIVKGKQLNREELTETGTYPCQNGGVLPSGFTENFNTNENTITISEGGNSCGHINYQKTKFWSGGHCYSLLELENEIDVIFLFQYLKFNENKIKRLRVGSGLPNIQRKDIILFKVYLPSIEEQTKIANFLSSIDTKIDVEVQLLQKLKEQKKYLLQQMFC